MSISPYAHCPCIFLLKFDINMTQDDAFYNLISCNKWVREGLNKWKIFASTRAMTAATRKILAATHAILALTWFCHLSIYL